jgi:hypothetical protein
VSRARRVVALAAALVGGVLAWVASGPWFQVGINWDQGAYIAAAGTGRLLWAAASWNAHFAIGDLYLLGCAIARAAGGTVVDGFRLTNALFYAVACGFVADAAGRVARRPWLGLPLALVWAGAWVNVFFHVTLEDNVLYLAPAAALLWLCARRANEWRARDSAVGGALAAFAALQSWQAIFYLGPPLYAALVARGARDPLRRAVEVLLVPVAFLTSLVAWCVLLAVTSQQTVRALCASLFARPTGRVAFHPLFDWHSHASIIGRVAGWYWTHSAYEPPPMATLETEVGFRVLALVAAVLLVATVARLRRGGISVAHLFAVPLAAFTLATPLYNDEGFRYLVRFDFWPLFGVLLVACALGAARGRAIASAAAIGLVLLFAVELQLGLGWARTRMARAPELPSYLVLPHPYTAWDGRAGKSWFAYFRSVREAHPQACRYVLALAELWEGSWKTDIPASLWSELPNHLVLGEPEQVSGWRDPPRMATVDEARRGGLADGCAWVSADARRLLDGAPLPR